MQYSNASIQSERRNERLKFGAYGVSFISLGLALAALGPCCLHWQRTWG